MHWIRAARPAWLAALLLAVPLTTGAAAELRRGSALTLSTGVAPTLNSVEVHRVKSTGLIDVAVILDAPRAELVDADEELLEYGELCLRHGAVIVQAAVPADEQGRLRVMAIFYRAPVAGDPKRFVDRGFVFDLVEGACALNAAYPAALRAEARRRAALGD